jgi:hypothetical protein
VSDLLTLVERCEKAAGPDRELDCLIFESQHLLLMPNHRGTIDGEPTGEYFSQDGHQLPERAPLYTGSIDAAMALVPEGYWTALDHFCMSDIPGKTKWRTFLNRHFEIGDRDYLQKSLAVALTPALALCAAALRARAVPGAVGNPAGSGS